MSETLKGIYRECRERRIRTAGLGLAAALALAACVDSSTPAQSTTTHGTIGMALAGRAPSGVVYRLRDATITVQGPVTTLDFRTEDDANRTLISADVEVGDYVVSLSDGWRFEQVNSSSSTYPVDARLVSDNPQFVTIFGGTRTQLALRFRVGSDDIPLDQGGIEIGIEVDD